MTRVTPFAVLLLAAPPAAQDFITPVHDLVAVPVRAGSFAPPLWVDRFSPRPSDPETLENLRGFLGERELLLWNREFEDDPHHFSADALADIVTMLAELDETVAVQRGSLRAPEGAGKRVRLALDWLRSRVGHGVEYEIELARIDGDEHEILLSGIQTAHGSSTSVFADVGQRSVLWDYEVEIAQGSTLAKPVIAEERSGASVAVLARPLADGASALVQSIVRVVEPDEPSRIRLGHDGFGDVERIASQVGDAALTFILPRDGRSVHEWSDAAGRRLRLTCRASWAPPPPTTAAAAVLSRAVLGGEPIVELSVPRSSRSLAMNEFAEPALNTAGQRTWESFVGGGLPSSMTMIETGAAAELVVFGGAGAADTAAAVSSALEDALVPVEVAIDVFDVPVGGSVDGSDGPSTGTRCLASASGPAVATLPICFRAGDQRTFLHHWEALVALNARIPDPWIGIIETGSALEARVRVDHSGRPRAVELACDLEQLDELASRPIALSQATHSPGAVVGRPHVPRERTGAIYVDDVPAIAMPKETVSIEQPVTRAHRIELSVPLDQDGTAELRRRARTFTGPGREIVVRVRARSLRAR